MTTTGTFYLSFLNRLCHFASFDTDTVSQPKQKGVITRSLADKEKHLERYISHLGSVLIAYSGDIESAYLAYVAHKVLRDRMLALIPDCPSLSRQNFQEAIDFAKSINIPVRSYATGELEDPNSEKYNSISCFHSKYGLFKAMERARAEYGFRHLAFAIDADDLEQFRPGQQVALNNGILAPLAEANLNKEEIRALVGRLNCRDFATSTTEGFE